MSKKYKQLTLEQRYVIDVELKAHTPVKDIAEKIGRDPSTIYREINRNKTAKRGCYNYKTAEEYTKERRERNPKNKVSKRVIDKALKHLVDDDWSPEQISGYMKNEGYSISHERIYQEIRKDKTGELKKHCRFGLKHRNRDIVGKAGVKHIPDRVDITERPEEADGKRFGDWEMDLIVGPENKGAILVFIERSRNYVLMKKLPNGKEAVSLAKVAVTMLFPYRENVNTITTDNGSEFAAHKAITEGLALRGKPGPIVYFAKPYASWQKGAVENMNQLIRQYIPKKTSFDQFSDEDIQNIQNKLNTRPRKKLGFKSPLVAFAEAVR